MCALFNARRVFYLLFVFAGFHHVMRIGEKPHRAVRPSSAMRGCRGAVPKRRSPGGMPKHAIPDAAEYRTVRLQANKRMLPRRSGGQRRHAGLFRIGLSIEGE